MTSHKEWDEKTGAIEVTSAFADEVKGKNVVLTGVSPNSVGEGVAVAVAAQQPGILILASRTQSKLDEVVGNIKKSYPDANVKTVTVDLLSQASIKHAAEEINNLTDRIHVLINNAGVMDQKRVTSAEGIEGQLAANHVGPFLLTNLVIDRLRTAASASKPGSVRVINVSSLGHRLSPIRFHDYNLEGKDIPEDEQCPFPLTGTFASTIDGYPGFLAYGQSKTANVLFSVALTQRLKNAGIVSYALHPGSIWSGLIRGLNPDGEVAIRGTSKFWKNTDQGGATTCVAAFDPALSNPEGLFLSDCQFVDAASHATDPVQADKLWALSEKLVGQQFEVC